MSDGDDSGDALAIDELSDQDVAALRARLDALDQRIGPLPDRVDVIDRRLGVLEAQEEAEPWHNGSPSATDFLSTVAGSPGYVVDEAVARETPCIGYALRAGGSEPDLVFSRGIVGPLDKPQRELYCPTTEVRELSASQRSRLEAFAQATAACQATDPAPGMEASLSCLERELRSRGQRL